MKKVAKKVVILASTAHPATHVLQFALYKRPAQPQSLLAELIAVVSTMDEDGSDAVIAVGLAASFFNSIDCEFPSSCDAAEGGELFGGAVLEDAVHVTEHLKAYMEAYSLPQWAEREWHGWSHKTHDRDETLEAAAKIEKIWILDSDDAGCDDVFIGGDAECEVEGWTVTQCWPPQA